MPGTVRPRVECWANWVEVAETAAADTSREWVLRPDAEEIAELERRLAEEG